MVLLPTLGVHLGTYVTSVIVLESFAFSHVSLFNHPYKYVARCPEKWK